VKHDYSVQMLWKQYKHVNDKRYACKAQNVLEVKAMPLLWFKSKSFSKMQKKKNILCPFVTLWFS
jgi:hypothetical protein